MKKLKRVLAGSMCSFLAAGLFAGCSSNKSYVTEENLPVVSESIARVVPVTEAPSSKAVDHKTMKGTLRVWHFNAGEAPYIDEAFKKEFPKVDLRLSAFADKDYIWEDKIIQAIKSGTGVPDVFTVESSVVKRLVEIPDIYADITEKAKEVSADMAKYTMDIGTDSKGAVRALTHQVTPGGIGYKKSVAKKYLGTDNPDKIAAMLSNPDKILETAKKLKKASKGKIALFPSWEEIERQAVRARSVGWVVDGKFNIDQKVLDLIEFSKKMRDNKYEAGFDAWSSSWYSAIADDEVAMCWTIPTWGVPWIIGANDEKEKENPTGKWGICKGPFSYAWGGTWWGICSKSQNVDLAWEFIKWWTSDKEHLKEWNEKTGDIPNSMSLLSEFAADSTKVDKIIGTNLFKFYKEWVGSVNGTAWGQYDDKIENIFCDIMKSYLAGKIANKEQVLTQFKANVKEKLKEITVE